MTDSVRMKIAIASSGLGHVLRGIETWAADTAAALAARGADVTLFGACGLPDGGAPRTVCLRGLRRGDALARRLARWSPRASWRWGLRSAYGWEQLSFWLRLWPHLRRGAFDILHVQDPMLADWCRRSRLRGWVPTREILAHGTEEPHAFVCRFEHVQHLAPWHMEQALAALPGEGGAAAGTRAWAAIPNFVDCDRFAPSPERRRALRARLGIPEAARVVGCAAAVKKDHKRIDYLVREFSAWLERTGEPRPYLLVAGARQDETDEVVALAQRLAPDRIRFLLDCPRADMPAFYAALDVFVLPSLFEMMPIAVLEALASGLPVVANRHPVLEWMTGEGGLCADLAGAGSLADALSALTPDRIAELGAAAREQALRQFARDVVIGEYEAYYRRVLSRDP